MNNQRQTRLIEKRKLATDLSLKFLQMKPGSCILVSNLKQKFCWWAIKMHIMWVKTPS